jgi:hypothetical protein
MDPKTVIVTMFFDLSKLVDANPATRPMSFYLEHARAVLRLPFPMIIFCDDVTRGPLERIRLEELGSSSIVVDTWYQERRIDDYDLYKMNWDTITENRRKSRGYKNPVNRNTVSYYLMGMIKLQTIYLAKKQLPGFTHYAWIDIGCNYMVRGLQENVSRMLEHPRDKVGACYIHYRDHSALYPYEKYMEYGAPCGMATTAFTVAADYVDRYYCAVMSVFYEMMAGGYGHTDETVMTYCYDRYGDNLFSIYYGDYKSVFENYTSPQTDVDEIIDLFFCNTMELGKHDLACACAQAILDSLDQQEKTHEHAWYLRDYLKSSESTIHPR